MRLIFQEASKKSCRTFNVLHPTKSLIRRLTVMQLDNSNSGSKRRINLSDAQFLATENAWIEIATHRHNCFRRCWLRLADRSVRWEDSFHGQAKPLCSIFIVRIHAFVRAPGVPNHHCYYCISQNTSITCDEARFWSPSSQNTQGQKTWADACMTYQL